MFDTERFFDLKIKTGEEKSGSQTAATIKQAAADKVRKLREEELRQEELRRSKEEQARNRSLSLSLFFCRCKRDEFFFCRF